MHPDDLGMGVDVSAGVSVGSCVLRGGGASPIACNGWKGSRINGVLDCWVIGHGYVEIVDTWSSETGCKENIPSHHFRPVSKPIPPDRR